MRRSFHWKRLLIVLVVLGTLGGGLFAFNRVQVRKQASVIKLAAEKAEATIEGDAKKRAEVLARYAQYLKFNPTDEAAATKYAALLLAHHKANPSADSQVALVQGLESFLRNFPNHPDLRRELADVYITNRSTFGNAREHLEMMYTRGGQDKDVEIIERLATCEQVLGDLPKAITRLEEAIVVGRETNAPLPLQVRVYQKVLEFHDANKQDSKRELTIGKHLQTLRTQPPFATSVDARVVVARFELKRNGIHQAQKDVQAALQLAGGTVHPDALVAAAELEIVEARLTPNNKGREEKLKVARDHLVKAHAADPKGVAVGVFLAETHERLGERDQAANVLLATATALGEVNDLFLVVIDHLIDLGNKDISAKLLERVREKSSAQPQVLTWVVYFEGRLAVLNEDWALAKQKLEEAEPSLGGQHESRKRALFDLARVYATLQNPDKQLECCQIALRVPGPVFPPALIGEAEALGKLGRINDAIQKYQLLVTHYQATKLRPTLVRLRLVATLSQRPDSRNWESFDSLENLGAEEDRTDDILVFQAQAFAARGERDKAVALLDRVVQKKGKDAVATTAWVNMARVKEIGRPEAALAILEEAAKQVGDSVDLRLARAELLVIRAKPATAAEFEALATGAGEMLKPDQYRLWVGLGQSALAAASRPVTPELRKSLVEFSLRSLQTAAKIEPRDLLSRTSLIDLAVLTENAEVITQTLAELEQLEGKNGPIRNLARVAIELPQIPKLTDRAARDAKIKELRELATSAQTLRPSWGRPAIALGKLDELDGLPERAVENYRSALDHGERDEIILRRAIELYRDRKQDASAAALRDRLATKMVLPDDLERFRSIHELLHRATPTVPTAEVPTIDRIAPVTSKDYKILMMRGALLAAVREDGEALKAFRAAISIANPPMPETYEALVAQLVRTNQVPEAKVALGEAERVLQLDAQKTPAAKAELLLAFGKMRELVGEPQVAYEKYLQAAATAPSELSPNRRVIEFLMLNGRPAEAEKRLQALLSAPGQDLARWARRFLGAVAYLSRPNPYENRRAALTLIEENLKTAPNDPDDRKAQAVIWTVDPETRDKGMEVLRAFGKLGELTPDEWHLLGRLTFDQGPTKIPESVKFFENAVRPRSGVSVEHLASLVRVHLALNDVPTAELRLDRLKAAAPNSWEATREEARLLMRKSRAARLEARGDWEKLVQQARATIRNFKGYDTVEMIRLRTGPLLEELSLNDDARELYQKLLVEWKAPTAHLPLAILSVREKKSEEAIKLAQQHEATTPTLATALVYTGAVQSKRPGEALERYIETWLDKEIASARGKPELPVLMGAKGDFYDALGKHEMAIAEYRRSLAVAKTDNVVNNLAMLLALYEAPNNKPGSADEAIKLMNEVIAIRGPAPTFLDTRAVAYLIKGGDATEKALHDLEMALLQRVRPVYLFHLARAYDLQIPPKRAESERQFKAAIELGFTPADLHPLELPTYQQYVQQVPK